jgi:ABC-type phosphate transport system auxiliary subunit
LISRTLEEQPTCRFGAQMVDGGNYSNTKQIISAILIQEEVNVLVSNSVKMLKDKLYRLTLEMKRLNKDGELSTLMKLRRNQLKVLTKTGDSTLTDHSTLDQDFQ